MKRFLLFAFEHYYPSGGLLDVVESYDTVEEAIEASANGQRRCDELYILDRDLWRIVHGIPPKRYDQKTNTYAPIL